MSTIWGDATGIHDDFGTPTDVEEWLEAVGSDHDGARASASDLADAVRLRDAVRRVAAERTGDTRPAATSPISDVDEAIDVINSAASRARSPQLVRSGADLSVGAGGEVAPIGAALAEIARSSIALLGGEGTMKACACYAPGCVLYFVKSHPRREWCSVTCGNRARAARHYERVREERTTEHSAIKPAE
jgi:predicted RNA-binding Zn ribbon-like protein